MAWPILSAGSSVVVCLLVLACSSSERARPEAQPGAANDLGAGMGGSANDGTNVSEGSSSGGVASDAETQNEGLPLNPVPSNPMPAMPGAMDTPLGEPAQEALPGLPTVRQEHAVVALEGEVYVIGGFTPNATATVEAFEPGVVEPGGVEPGGVAPGGVAPGGSWRSVAALPSALHHANAAVVGGKIYVAGFYVGGSFTDVGGNVFEYDPVVNVWSERALMAPGRERASSCVAELDGKIYLFGGARGGTVADASVYDAAANTWRELPPLPEAREHCVAGAIDGALYVAAGRQGGITGFEPSTWAFDPVLETYTERAPIPTPRGGTAGAVVGEKLYVIGGEGNGASASGVFDEIEAFDPATNTWEALPAMLTPRHGLAAAALADRIYLPGGATTQGFGAVGDSSVMFFDAMLSEAVFSDAMFSDRAAD